MDYKYIEQLLERYFQCETTLKEEEILRSFFSQEDVPVWLAKYQTLFSYEAQQEEVLGELFDEQMLALIENYVLQHGKDLSAVCGQLGVDMTVDYEQAVYHPYPLVRKIYQSCGEDYHKHGSESFSFLSTLTVEDYEKLRLSGRCASFAKFIDSLIGGTKPQLP